MQSIVEHELRFLGLNGQELVDNIVQPFDRTADGYEFVDSLGLYSAHYSYCIV